MSFKPPNRQLWIRGEINSRLKNKTLFILNHGSAYAKTWVVMCSVNIASVSVECCDVSSDMLDYRGDGYCDRAGGLNSPQCNYDDGDCCEETCQGSLCGNNGYQCLGALLCAS